MSIAEIGGQGTAVAGGQTGQGGQGGQPGHFTDAWNLSADLKSDPVFENNVRKFADPAGLAKSYIEAQRMISSKGYTPPKPDAPQEVWDSWYAKTRPESPDGYSWKLADEDLAGLDEDTRKAALEEVAGIKAAFHKTGLDDRQANALLEMHDQWFERYQERSEQGKKDAEIKALAEADAKLKAEWGDKYGENLGAAKRAAQALGVADAFGALPAAAKAAFAKALARVDSQIGEAKLVGSQASKESLQERFKALSTQIAGMRPDNPDIQKLTEERTKLGMALFGGGSS